MMIYIFNSSTESLTLDMDVTSPMWRCQDLKMFLPFCTVCLSSLYKLPHGGELSAFWKALPLLLQCVKLLINTDLITHVVLYCINLPVLLLAVVRHKSIQLFFSFNSLYILSSATLWNKRLNFNRPALLGFVAIWMSAKFSIIGLFCFFKCIYCT